MDDNKMENDYKILHAKVHHHVNALYKLIDDGRKSKAILMSDEDARLIAGRLGQLQNATWSGFGDLAELTLDVEVSDY